MRFSSERTTTALVPKSLTVGTSAGSTISAKALRSLIAASNTLSVAGL
jgi:hypothetical protein